MLCTRRFAKVRSNEEGRVVRIYVNQFNGINALQALPLAAGLLVASARRDPLLDSAMIFHIEVRRQPVENVLEVYQDPVVLAFSCYTWNLRYTLEVARRARTRFPDALIVMGGPSVPRSEEAVARFFEMHPCCDVLVLGEGEATFQAILRAVLEETPLEEVAGLALPKGQGTVVTTPRPRMDDPGQTASPYLSGTFEMLARQECDTINAALVETNRGCPFSCTFCDWGQATQSHVYELPLKRVCEELDWIGTQEIPFLYIIDANFGIRPRDIRIIEHIARVKARTGYPEFCYFHLTKNAHARNLKTVETLQKAGIGCRMALSMQDFDPGVLRAIKRDNIKLSRSLHLRKLCVSASQNGN